jgi:galactose mutarotase-like enzyme
VAEPHPGRPLRLRRRRLPGAAHRTGEAQRHPRLPALAQLDLPATRARSGHDRDDLASAHGLSVHAGHQRRLPTDERGLPTGRHRVAGSGYDFRDGREIGEQEIDNTFTDLDRDADGRAWVGFAAPDGRRVSVWVDERYPFVEIYTSHTQPAPHWRTGLGVEPMTCAPNAFRSGDGLLRLEPGESHTASWGIVASR